MKKVGTVIKWILFIGLILAEIIAFGIGVYLILINVPQVIDEWFGDGMAGILERLGFLIFALAVLVGVAIVAFRILDHIFPEYTKRPKAQSVSFEAQQDPESSTATGEKNETPVQRQNSQIVSYKAPKGVCRDCIYFQRGVGIFSDGECTRWGYDSVEERYKKFRVNETSSCDDFCKRSTASGSNFSR